jgi:hypothetical protein
MAYTSLTSVVSTTMRWSASEDADLSTTTDSKTINYTATKTLGTATGEANLIWSEAIAAATLNLQSLSRSVFGVSGTFTFTQVKSLRIRNTGDVACTVSAAWGGISSMTLHPGAILVIDSDEGWAIAAGNTVSVAAGAGGTLEEKIEVVIVGVGTVTP